MRLDDVFVSPGRRRLLQVVAGASCLLAVGLAALDRPLAIAGSVAMIGAIALLCLKSALVAHAALSRLSLRVADENQWREEVKEHIGHLENRLTSGLSDTHRSIAELQLAANRYEQCLLPDTEAALMLARRAEPILAQVAIVQNEILALRDEIQRVDRRAAAADLGDE
jgi:hypothetical protein